MKLEINLLPSNTVSTIANRITSKPLLIFVFVLAFNLATNIPIALCFDAWYPNNQNFGYSREWGWWLIDFIAQPMLISYLVWIGPASRDLLEKLIAEKRLFYDENLEKQIKRATNRANNPWINRFAFLIGFLIQAIITISFLSLPTKTWVTAHPLCAYNSWTTPTYNLVCKSEHL
jgi:hypothetical protein